MKKFKQGHCGPIKAIKQAMKKAKEHAKKNKKRSAEEAQIPVDQRVHERITCDNCQVSPIVGIRYKCAESPDFDLCVKCEEAGSHSHHTFLKVKDPQHIDVVNAFRTEEQPEICRRGGKRRHEKWMKKNENCSQEESKEGLKPLIDEAFKFQPLLD